MVTSKERIEVIGLGYVGLPLAAEFGKVRPVLGFDMNLSRIEQLRAGVDSKLELNPAKLESAKYLEFCHTPEGLATRGVSVVTEPTPVDKVNQPDLKPLTAASQTVGKEMKQGSVVIYESTVYSGCTEEVCVPILEAASGVVFNRDFFCGYSPERINPGDKVSTLTKIQKITSGSTPAAALAVDLLYDSIITAGTYRAPSLKVEEAAKVIKNKHSDLNITPVNELSVIFDCMNIDTLAVLQAASSKSNFLHFHPGMVGGQCIGVDPYYLTYKAGELGYNPQVILAGRRINDNMSRYAAHNVIKRMLGNGMDVARCTVGVLGVTFKENCPDIRYSKVFELIRELQAWGVKVVLTDPYANAVELAIQYDLKLSTINADQPVDALVVAVGHSQYRQLTPEDIATLCKPGRAVVADLKSLYERHALEALGLTVFRL